MTGPRSKVARSKPLTRQTFEPPIPAPLALPDPRRRIYGAVDLAFAALHAVVLGLAPTRHAGGKLLFAAVIAAYAAAGVASLIGRRPGHRVAAAACLALLGLEVVLLVAMVASAAFLSGVFGAFGQGAAGITLVLAFLSIQLVALVPALQLKDLRTRAGRRAFGLDLTSGP
jgi:hypothetical protein